MLASSLYKIVEIDPSDCRILLTWTSVHWSGSLVEYDESDNEDEAEEFEPLTLDSFQFDVLQRKLADLNKRQKDLEQVLHFLLP
jgi:hypothetical protein